MPTITRKESLAAEFERRAARAEKLAPLSESARSPLLFAAQILRAQGEIAWALEEAHAVRPFTGRLEDDAERLLPLHPRLLHAAADKSLSSWPRRRARGVRTTRRRPRPA